MLLYTGPARGLFGSGKIMLTGPVSSKYSDEIICCLFISLVMVLCTVSQNKTRSVFGSTKSDENTKNSDGAIPGHGCQCMMMPWVIPYWDFTQWLFSTGIAIHAA